MSQNWKPSTDLSQPNPLVSNCGLVIVQVDNSKMSEEGDLSYRPPALVQWNPPPPPPSEVVENCSAAHQLIHGHPPVTLATSNLKPLSPVNSSSEPIDESVDEEEEEEEDGNVSDEGYR